MIGFNHDPDEVAYFPDGYAGFLVRPLNPIRSEPDESLIAVMPTD